MRKHPYSFVCLLILAYVLFQTLLLYPKFLIGGTESVMSWDVFGYYIYPPSAFIYHDLGDLSSIKQLFEIYKPAGDFHHAYLQPNGNYVMKYPIGLSIVYMPFFFIAHLWAKMGNYPADGFSFPYQFCLAFGSTFISVIGLAIMRKVLLRYFSDLVVCLSLIALVLGTNYFNYASTDGAMPHNFLFTVFALIIYLSIRWHENPKISTALLIGLCVGLATIMRPTDCLSALIPALWGVTGIKDLLNRFRFFLKQWKQVLVFGLGGLIAILPQLIYWKIYSGHFVYYSYREFGFHWMHPHLLDGLFSFKKGWLVYTPMMGFALLGFYFLFKKLRPAFFTILIFFAINLYIVFSWEIWWYGGSFGARALIESYALMIFPLAALIAWTVQSIAASFMIFIPMLFFIQLNLFQTYQCHSHGIGIHPEMSKAFYWRIFMNNRATFYDYKYLDVDVDQDTSHFTLKTLAFTDFESDSAGSALHPCSGLRSFRLDATHQYSSEIHIKADRLKFKDDSYFRVSAKFYYEDPEPESWKMMQLVLAIKKANGKNIFQVLRPGRIAPTHVCNYVFFDYKLPDFDEGDEISVYAWNAESSHEVFIDDMKLQLMEPK
ncbi:MAG: hypothetical protein ACJ75J_15330 [Cytophagaceae bacterium]